MKAAVATVIAALAAFVPLDGAAQLVESTTLPMPKVTVTGDRVSLNLEDEELSSVLRLLSEAKRISIVSGPDVTGTVSINLYDAPFEEALSAILGVAGFSHYRIGEIIYVTTEEQRLEMPVGSNNLELRPIPIQFAVPQELLTAIEGFLSPAGTAVLGNNKTIIVEDTPANVSRIERLVHSLDKLPLQVLIQAQILNVSRDDNMNVGIGFDTLPLTQYGVEVLSNGFANPFPPQPDPLTGEIPQTPLPTTRGLIAGTLQSDSRFFIEALETATDVEVLASPQVLALDGQIARIQVGDRLGFRVTTTTETASLESVEFLDVGTVLEVTPQISENGMIQMEIAPKVSSGTISTEGLPTESTTELNTSMIVENGQTVLIGGLLNATRQRVRAQIPILGDIPILGKLFGRNTIIDDESEVVVLITPRIVGPKVSAEAKIAVDATQERIRLLHEKSLISPVETPPPKRSPNKVFREKAQEKMRELKGESNPAAQVGHSGAPLPGTPIDAQAVEAEQ